MGDLRTDLTTLLDTATAAGSKTIAIAAIRAALGPEPDAPPEHHLVVDGQGWRMVHPHTCKTPDCTTHAVARRQLAAALPSRGRYRVTLGPAQGLSLARLAVSTSDSGT